MPVNHSLSQKDPRRMTVLSLLPPPQADIALTHSLHHDRFIEFMAISVIESIKLILRGVAFKMGVVLEVGVVRLRGKKSPPFQILDPPLMILHACSCMPLLHQSCNYHSLIVK